MINDVFAENSWYFRNALVRANYSNPQKGIQPDKSFLVKFFRNLLLGENNELKNRYMLIGYKDDENGTHTSTRTSTHTGSIDIQPSSENVTRLVLAIGKEGMSVKSMMEAEVQKMHFERIGHKESEITFVRHYPKKLVRLGQMLLITVFIDSNNLMRKT